MFKSLLTNHPLVNILFTVVLVMGAMSFLELPREQDPEINFNWVMVTTVLPGASAEDVEELVTGPLEDAIRNVQDIRWVISTTRESSSSILIRFRDISETLFDKRINDVRREVQNKANDELPEDRRMKFRIGINLGDVIEEEERIYGDGVNIAARIETLAEPGGVSISRIVYNQVRSKLKFGYENQGEHSVKNIAEPVKVYRVLMDPEDAGKIIGEEKPKQWRLAVVSVAVVLVLFAGGLTIWNHFLKPSLPTKDKTFEDISIAVLPFDNMSNDPEQEYFSNGISENLITDLSKVPDFLVIARNTSFAYKGKSLTIEQIAAELSGEQ